MTQSPTFLIATSLYTGASMQAMVLALQAACDNGVACSFQTLAIPGGHLVMFQRSATDADYEYITARMARTGQPAGQAAIDQLRKELQECAEAPWLRQVLTQANFEVIDFNGELSRIDEEFSARSGLSKVPEQGAFWVTQGGTLVQVIRQNESTDGWWVRDGENTYQVDSTGKAIGFASASTLAARSLAWAVALHLPEAGLPDTWLQPIAADQEAEAFLATLDASGQLFHPDDDPGTVLAANGTPLFRPELHEVNYFHPDPAAYCLTLHPERVPSQQSPALGAF